MIPKSSNPLIWTALFLAAAVSPALLIAQRCPRSPAIQKYNPARSRLQGKLLQRTVFGLPGYGENPTTDPKVKILILRLGCPIAVEPVSNGQEPDLDPFTGIREIQLFFDGSSRSAVVKRYLNTNIVVVGTLHQGIAGGEFTQVTMDVEKIALLSKQGVPGKHGFAAR